MRGAITGLIVDKVGRLSDADHNTVVARIATLTVYDALPADLAPQDKPAQVIIAADTAIPATIASHGAHVRESPPPP